MRRILCLLYDHKWGLPIVDPEAPRWGWYQCERCELLILEHFEEVDS